MYQKKEKNVTRKNKIQQKRKYCCNNYLREKFRFNLKFLPK